MTTWITICDTCMRQGRSDREVEEFDGQRFAGAVEEALAASDGAGVESRRHSCLMGCANGCNVAIQAEGKLCYTLGGFDGSAEEAAAVVEYARLHADSPRGQVPYRQWPQPIKGHFVTRHPPLPGDAESS